MLPDFRFVLGAMLAAALLAVTALGFVTALRLPHQTARMGPIDGSRSLAYDDRADWSQLYDSQGLRRLDGLAPPGPRTEAERRIDVAPEAPSAHAIPAEPASTPAVEAPVRPQAQAPADAMPAASTPGSSAPS